MQQPPLLPAETLARVLRLARFDGMSVLLVAGVFALVTASNGNTRFAVIGLLAAGAGAIELHGAALLRQGSARGMRWLLASQPLLLLVIWSYCALRATTSELPPIPEEWQPLFAASAQGWGVTVEDYVRAINRISAGVLAAVALGFQGGLFVYYFRRRAVVAQACEGE